VSHRAIRTVAEQAGVQRHTLAAHFPDERSLHIARLGLLWTAILHRVRKVGVQSIIDVSGCASAPQGSVTHRQRLGVNGGAAALIVASSSLEPTINFGHSQLSGSLERLAARNGNPQEPGSRPSCEDAMHRQRLADQPFTIGEIAPLKAGWGGPGRWFLPQWLRAGRIHETAEMTTLRLIADDLTGALDTAAELVGLAGPVSVYWSGAVPVDLPTRTALDTGTRELGREGAIAATAQLAKSLVGASIAFKKVDSLLRGHTMAELAACLQVGSFPYCVVAPAFPYQGRVTRAGVQFRKTGDREWLPVADVCALLAEAGLAAARGDYDDRLVPGITVFDAETDVDLRRVAEIGREADGPVLWCGSAGLAQALAGSPPSPTIDLKRPILGLFGSDQAVTARQLAACGPYHLKLANGGPRGAADLATRLGQTGIALASLDLPSGLNRREAGQRIDRELARLTQQIRPPATLIVAGGETLRGLCIALGATALEAQGQVEPGVPRSKLRGGHWDGVDVVSKSGAFGGPNLWRDLLNLSSIDTEVATP
jgi:uncharacterized protein YgbK (DUF1537 family)